MIYEEGNLFETGANLKVIGIGGCGGNAVQNMIDNGIEGVEFICANTDAQDLSKSGAIVKIPLGKTVSKGRGAGSKPEIGREACLENREEIRDILAGTEMLFLTAGMGGGTGTGASPVIAEIAAEMEILTVGVVTTPFEFEGNSRMRAAQDGIAKLSKNVDSIIIVPNEKLLTELPAEISMEDAYRASDSVLKGAVQGIADLITTTGKMNVDFADVTTVMSESGQAMMGTGESSGANRAEEAAQLAVSSPLLNNINLKNAKAVLVNITASNDLTLREFAQANNQIKSMAADNATIIIGTVVDESLGDKIKVTVVATGLSQYEAKGQSKKSAVPEDSLGDTKYQASMDGTYKIPDDNGVLEAGEESVSVDDTQSAEDLLDIPTFLRNQKN